MMHPTPFNSRVDTAVLEVVSFSLLIITGKSNIYLVLELAQKGGVQERGKDMLDLGTFYFKMVSKHPICEHNDKRQGWDGGNLKILEVVISGGLSQHQYRPQWQHTLGSSGNLAPAHLSNPAESGLAATSEDRTF